MGMEKEWTAMNSWEEGLNGVTGKSPVGLIDSGNQPPRAIVTFYLVTYPYLNLINKGPILEHYSLLYLYIVRSEYTNFNSLIMENLRLIK